MAESFQYLNAGIPVIPVFPIFPVFEDPAKRRVYNYNKVYETKELNPDWFFILYKSEKRKDNGTFRFGPAARRVHFTSILPTSIQLPHRGAGRGVRRSHLVVIDNGPIFSRSILLPLVGTAKDQNKKKEQHKSCSGDE